MKRISVTSVVILSCVCLCHAQQGKANWLQGKSIPSRDLTLSFVQPGTIRTVHVAQGQLVKEGMVLVELDDSVEQVQLAQARAEADDKVRVEAAKARLATAKLDYESTRQAAEGGGASKTEVQHAMLEVTINDLSVQLAQFQQAQARLKADEIAKRLERMKLRSQTQGRVEKIHLRAGESADALQEVIQVVRVDPLWIDVDVPISQAKKFTPAQKGQPAKPDQAAYVKLGSEQAKPLVGRILFRSAVGDAPSQTLTMRIEVPNGSQIPAGQFCWVRLGVDPADLTDTSRPAQDKP